MMSVGNVHRAISQPLPNFFVDLVIRYPPKPMAIPLKVFKVKVWGK
jgi:hypothetical protein